jgi:DNA-binding transcriptional LysR family regulator
LGISIFKKKTQPIETTAEGAELVEQARFILEKVEELIKPFKTGSIGARSKVEAD